MSQSGMSLLLEEVDPPLPERKNIQGRCLAFLHVVVVSLRELTVNSTLIRIFECNSPKSSASAQM